eukprot:2612009-Amphidinium_carterae.1
MVELCRSRPRARDLFLHPFWWWSLLNAGSCRLSAWVRDIRNPERGLQGGKDSITAARSDPSFGRGGSTPS